MTKKLREFLVIFLAAILVTTMFTPAVLATDDTQQLETNNKRNKFASELSASNASLFNKISALQTLKMLDGKSSKKTKLESINRTKYSIKQFRDSYRIKSHEAIKNDTKTIKDLKLLVDSGQNKLIDKTTKLLYVADRQTVQKSINDTRKLIKDLEKQIDDKNIRKFRDSVEEAESALKKASKTLKPDAGLKKRLNKRAKAVHILWLSWIELQRTIDKIDKLTKPEIDIKNRLDLPHKDSIKYKVRVNVTDPQTYELQNATIYLNGNKKTETKIKSRIHTKPLSTFEVSKNITLSDKNQNKIKATVKDVKENGINAELTVIEAIAGPDLRPDFKEFREGIYYWAREIPVPLTDNKKVTYMDLRKLYRMWKSGSSASSVQSFDSLVKKTQKKINSGEVKRIKAPSVTISRNPQQKASDTLILDGDGLPSDYEQKVTRTNPEKYNSDSSKTSTDESTNNKPDGAEDYDDDNLRTLRELQMGSDAFSKNSDTDKLSDTYEAKYPQLDATKTDTNGNGVNDHRWDPDNDTLTVIEEEKQGTAPFDADLDRDSLNDSRETEYGTNHTKKDTDDDGLKDPDEIAVGTDPLKKDTDNDGTIDGNEKFTTQKQNNTLGTSVKVTGKGNIADSVTINDGNRKIFKTEMVEKTVSSEIINYESSKSFEQAKIKIKYNESEVENEENLSIYRYNTSLQTFSKVDSTIDTNANTVTATTSHFSRYTVMNVNKWETKKEKIYSSEKLLKTGSSGGSTNRASTSSSSGSGEDRAFVLEQGSTIIPIEPLSYKGQTIETFYDYYDAESHTSTELEQSDMTHFFMYKGPKGISLVFLHDRRDDGSGGAVTMKFEGLPVNNGNWIIKDDSGDDWENGGRRVDWAWADSHTDGGVFRGGLNGDFNIKVNPQFNEDAEKNPLDGGTMKEWDLLTGDASDPEYIPLDMSKPINITTSSVTNAKDSDDDGIPDVVEESGVPTGMGKFYTDPYDNDTDGDKLEDGQEIPVGKIVDTSDGSYFKMVSNPVDTDTDGDGLSDTREAKGTRTAFIDNHGKAEDYLKKTGKFLEDEQLSDSEKEQLNGFFTNKTVKTNLRKPDSDEDSLTDMQEARLNTNPRNNNTDDDGLLDDAETRAGNTDHKFVEERKHDPTMYDIKPPSLEGATASTNRYLEYGCKVDGWNSGCGADLKVVHKIDYLVEDENTHLKKIWFLKNQERKVDKDISGRIGDGVLKLKTGVLKNLGILKLTQDGLKGISVSLEVTDQAGNRMVKGIAAAGGLATMVGEGLVKLIPNRFGDVTAAAAAGLWAGVMNGIGGLVKTIEKLFKAIRNPGVIWDWINQMKKALAKLGNDFWGVLEKAFEAQFRLAMEKTSFYNVDRSKDLEVEYDSQSEKGQAYALGWITGYVAWTVGTLFFPGGQAVQAMSKSGKVATIMSKISAMGTKLSSMGRAGLKVMGLTDDAISRGAKVTRVLMRKGDWAANKVESGIRFARLDKFTSTGSAFVKMNRLRRIDNTVDDPDVSFLQTYRFVSNAGEDSMEILRRVSNDDDVDIKSVVNPDYLDESTDLLDKYQESIGDAFRIAKKSDSDIDTKDVKKAIKTADNVASGSSTRAEKIVEILDESPQNGIDLLSELGDSKIIKVAKNTEELKRFEFVRRAGDDGTGMIKEISDTVRWGRAQTIAEIDDIPDDMVDRMFSKMAQSYTRGNLQGDDLKYFLDYAAENPSDDISLLMGQFVEVDPSTAARTIRKMNDISDRGTAPMEDLARAFKYVNSPAVTDVGWAGVNMAIAFSRGEVKRIPDYMNASWVLKRMKNQVQSASDKSLKTKQLSYELNYTMTKLDTNSELELKNIWERDKADAVMNDSDNATAYEVIVKDYSDKSYSETNLDSIIEHYNNTVDSSSEVDDYTLVFTQELPDSIEQKLNDKNVDFEYFIGGEISEP